MARPRHPPSSLGCPHLVAAHPSPFLSPRRGEARREVPLNILFLSGEFPPQGGGVGDYTDRLAAALAARGDEVAVITSPLPAAAPNGDAVWAARPDARVFRAVARWDLRAWRAVAARIRAERPDVVHLQYQAAAYGNRGAPALFPWLLRAWNIRPLFVTTFHDLLAPHLLPLSGRLGLDRSALAWLVRGGDAAIATNAEDAERLVALRARRVWQVPIGPNIPLAEDPFDREAWRRGLGVAPADPLLGYFGYYNASKGLEELLEAFARLLPGRPATKLLLIGGGAGETDPTNRAYAQRLRRRAAELSLGDRVIWTGFADAAAVSAHLRAVDLLVLPFRDGLSLRRGTLMAGLAHGCAIVASTPARPIPELAGAVRTFPAGDAAALERAIVESLDGPEQRRLSAAALAAAERFRWPAIAEAHAAIYRRLCRSES